jgi:staphyloferrin B biosynthesis citrate synthase
MKTRARPPACEFRRRLLAREPLLGTFIKTPTIHTTEILGELGFDFVVIDTEHAPFSRVSVDQILLAAKAWDIAALVRVERNDGAPILAALDDGAAGILVPHVASPAQAAAMVAASRYRGGRRGFSNSPRAGGYGRAGIAEHVDTADSTIVAMAMIEDPEALEQLDSILSTPGLDAAFIGRGDLTVALGASEVSAPEVRSAVESIAIAGRAASKPLCAHLSDIAGDEARWLASLGVTAFIVASDQGLLRRAGARMVADFAASQG